MPIAHLEASGFRISGPSRLPSSVRLLRQTADAGEWPSDAKTRARLLAAIRNAAEWPLVVSTYSESLKGEVRDDFERALGGSLDQASSEALQFQAQLFFGAVLAQSPAVSKVPLNKGVPDLVIYDVLSTHGVEVKAPTSLKGLRAAVSKGEAQLKRLPGGGVLVVDVTSAFDADESGAESVWDYEVLKHRVTNYLDGCWRMMHDLVPPKIGYRPNQGVILSAVVARPQRWLRDSNGEIHPGSAYAAMSLVHALLRGSLSRIKALRLQEVIDEGISGAMPEAPIESRPRVAP